MTEDLFDPDEKYGDESEWLKTPGTYLLAFSSFRGTDRNRDGNRYCSFRVEVVAGSMAGQALTERVFLHKKAWGRLSILCKAMGLTTEDRFDVNDITAVKRALMRRPFKAVVEMSAGREAGRVFANIGSIKGIDTWTPDEEVAAESWVAKQAERSDDWDGSAGSSGFGDVPPPVDDDNIPF